MIRTLRLGSIATVKEGRALYWYKLRDYGMELNEYTFSVAQKSKVPKETLVEAPAAQPAGKDAKGKPTAKDPKAAKGA